MKKLKPLMSSESTEWETPIEPRVLAWFSCGIPSALTAKLLVDKYGDRCEVLYCDTLKYEHLDNLRFLKDCEKWIGKPIKLLRSEKYKDIFDVFDKTGWLVGPSGARCTTELKKLVRREYQREGDIQSFGFTFDEQKRITQAEFENPEVNFEWILRDTGMTREATMKYWESVVAIRPPAMYLMGYKNNNCIGCVKGQMGYWNKIRVDFPKTFERMAKQERKMDVAICKRYEGKNRIRVFLDELDPKAGRYDAEPDIECGVLCMTGTESGV